MVLIDGLVAFNADKIFGGGQFAVKICSRYHDFLIFRKTSCRIFHNGKGGRQHLVQSFFVDVQYFFFNFVYLVEEVFAFFQFRTFYFSFQFVYFGTLLGSRITDVCFQLCRFGAKRIIVQFGNFRVYSFDFINPGLYLFHVPGGFVPKN